MPYPNVFYHYEKRGEPLYQSHPPGMADINRLIKSLPYWLSPELTSIKVPKKLIYADWSCNGWSPEKVDQVETLSQQLIQEGFEIYLWEDKQVKPYQSQKLSLLAKQPLALPQEIIHEAVETYQFLQDEICVVDDYLFKVLLGEINESAPRHLYIDDLIDYDPSDQEFQELIKMLKQATPPLQGILFNEYSERCIELQTESSQAKLYWDGLNIISDYQKIFLNYADYISLIYRRGVYYKHTTLNLDNIENVVSLTLDFGYRKEVKLKDLKIILDKTPKLKFLEIINCFISLEDASCQLNINSVEKIELKDGVISAKALGNILLSGSNIKEAQFVGAELLGNFTQDVAFPQLTTLHLNFDLDAVNAKRLINSLPNLQNLLLPPSLVAQLKNDLPFERLTDLHVITPIKNSPYDAVDAEILFSKLGASVKRLNLTRVIVNKNLNQFLNLTGLESIKLTSVTMEFNTFQKLIENSVSLKKIEVEKCGFNSSYILPYPLKLPNLSKILIAETDIPFENIVKLSGNSPQLNSINLRAINFDSLAEENIEPLLLPHLQELILVDLSGLWANQVETILTHATKLRTFEWKSNTTLKGQLTCKFELPNLEIVEFSQSESTKFMRSILKGAVNLTKLTIKDSRIQEDGDAEHITFNKLRELELDRTDVSHGLLLEFLDKNRELTSINIKNGDIDLNVLEKINLPNLRMLSVYSDHEGYIPLIDLRCLKKIAHANKLQSLKLIGCDFLEFLDNNLSFPKLKEINLTSASIAWMELAAILDGAPHLEILNLRFLNLIANKTPPKDFTLPFLKELNLQSCLADNLHEIFTALTAHSDIKAMEITPEYAANPPEPQMNNTQDPIYHPQEQKDFKPTPPNKKFFFTGKNRTKNQDMVIEKLSQYLTLRKKHLHLIPEIQDGICAQLTMLFAYKSLDEWQYFLDTVANWDGNITTITPELQMLLDELCGILLKNNVKHDVIYVGDALLDYLLPYMDITTTLNNAWHAIGVRFLPLEEVWFVFDPNSITGGLKVSSHELCKQIADYIGTCITINAKYVTPQFTKINPDIFIENGGLILLSDCKNANDLLEQLNQHPEFSNTALNGLLLRNVHGIPAWLQALQRPKLVALALALLRQFIDKNPESYIESLKHSAEVLDKNTRDNFSKQLATMKNSADQDVIQILYQALSEPFYQECFDEGLSTWDSTKLSEVTPSPFEYYQQIAQNRIRKRLIQLTTSQNLANLQFGYESFCRSIHRPVFIVNSPEDLICSAPFIERNGNKGYLRKGPGGKLYDFIQANAFAIQSPIILINYERFKAADIVRFNSVLDNERIVDGIPIPSSFIIIGLVNTSNLDCYRGEDFYSRFDEVEICPLPSIRLPDITHYKANEHHDAELINLYHSVDWENQLLGQWILENGCEFSFTEGKLQSALQKSHTICFQNGLWSSDKFTAFWQQAQQRGFIEHAGRTLKLPTNFKILRHEGYDWTSLTQQAYWLTRQKSGAAVLNPSLFSHFIPHYNFNPTQQMLKSDQGILAANKDRVLHVNVTRNLNEDNWAQLLDAAKENKILLAAHCSPGVSIPEAMNIELKATNPEICEWKGDLTRSTMVIQSSDIDTTVAMLKSIPNKNWRVIDISECRAEDLLIRINHELNEKDMRLAFQQTDCVLTKAMQSNRNIILKGKFNIDLIDLLAPLLLLRQDSIAENNLLLVTQDAKDFGFINLFSHTVKIYDKLQFLSGPVNKLYYGDLNTESLCRLQARLNYLSIFPDYPSDNAWAGLNTLPSKISLQNFDATNSKKIADDFIAMRLHSVHTILKHSPYAYITGLTATGKSTFVEDYLAKGRILYRGESNMKAWALDHSGDQHKILFIDEANLSDREWSELEGMYDTPPGIIIDGQHYPLTDKHKVVFAGNPASYSRDRKVAPFFERHGNAIVFEPMPLEFIYEYILKPVFDNTNCAQHSLGLCEPILKLYQFLCECSTDTVLITPRELQMMGLFIIASNNNDQAIYFVRDMGKRLVPAAHQADFDKLFPLAPPPEVKLEAWNHKGYYLTPSREPVYQLLIDMLNVSAYKKLFGTNDAQKFGGMNCIILEGDSGVGKSELVLAVLRAHNYQEFRLDSDIQAERVFCRVPVSMELTAKKALLEKAVNAGAVIIMDEINSSPMLERFMNELLMNKLSNGNRPQVPGALIIGTQNPVTMAGRFKPPSNAWSRRVITETVLPYNKEEITAILVKNNVPLFIAKLATNSFLKQEAHAIHHHLTPKPTFRHLLRFVHQVMEQNKNLSWLYKTPVFKKPIINDPMSDDESKSVDITSENFINNYYAYDHKRTFFSNNKPPSDSKAIPHKKVKLNDNVNSTITSLMGPTPFHKRKHTNTNTNNNTATNDETITPTQNFGLKKRH